MSDGSVIRKSFLNSFSSLDKNQVLLSKRLQNCFATNFGI